MSTKYGIQNYPTLEGDVWEVWLAMGEELNMIAKFKTELGAVTFIQEREKIKGTPETLRETIHNGLHKIGLPNQSEYAARILETHVRDFIAQRVGFEMLQTSSSATIEVLQRLMNTIDKKPVPSTKLLLESRKVNK